MISKYYVTMTDKFMSNWGPARGLKNKLIFLCDNLEEAEIVYNNAKNREEMIDVYICHTRPAYLVESKMPDYKHPSRGYYVQVKTKEKYNGFYEKNKFDKQ